MLMVLLTLGSFKLTSSVQSRRCFAFFFENLHDHSDDWILPRKIQRGFDVFERNTGSAHPSALQLKRSTKRGNGVPLTDDNSHLWYGPITVGTPAATYTGGLPFRHWVVTVG